MCRMYYATFPVESVATKLSPYVMCQADNNSVSLRALVFLFQLQLFDVLRLARFIYRKFNVVPRDKIEFQDKNLNSTFRISLGLICYTSCPNIGTNFVSILQMERKLLREGNRIRIVQILVLPYIFCSQKEFQCFLTRRAKLLRTNSRYYQCLLVYSLGQSVIKV